MESDIANESYLSRLAFENIKHYTAQSKFSLRIVDKDSYKKWLNETKVE
jgi:hypothetical protein